MSEEPAVQSSETPPLPPPSSSGTTDGPSPLAVGTRFVKQYYNTLSTVPDQIVRFYQPTSVLSVGSGSNPAEIVQDQISAAARFQNGPENSTTTTTASTSDITKNQDTEQIRFEFEHGAIDAQASVNNGVLLVATGHIVYGSTPVEEYRRAFVHTFFLDSMVTGNKRSYYIHNDILRFISEKEEHIKTEKAPTEQDESPTVDPVGNNKTDCVVTEETVVAASKVPSKEEKDDAAEPTMDEPPAMVRTTNGTTGTAELGQPHVDDVAASVTEPISVAPTNALQDLTKQSPGGGVEESKESILVEDITHLHKEVGTVPVTHQQEDAAASSEASKIKDEKAKAPGSWASMVARQPVPTPPATPSRGTVSTEAVEIKKPVTTPKVATSMDKITSPPKVAVTAPVPVSNGNINNIVKPNRERSGKRDPECTLVIKNIDSDTVESEIMTLFEPFAVVTKTRVVGCTVSASRGIAFVDYDSTEPVIKAVDQQMLAAFYIRERKLEIYQKTAEQQQRPRGGGGGGRGGSSGREGKSGVGGGRGRDYRRKNSGGGGRGERSGRGRESGREGQHNEPSGL